MSVGGKLIVAVATTAVVAMLGSCTANAQQPSARPSTVVPSERVPHPPSGTAAQHLLGAAALGTDPRTSKAGRPVDTVTSITPAPADATKEKATPDSCHQNQTSAKLTTCVFGDPDGTVDVVVAGDSKTQQWVPALDVAAKQLGWRLTVHTKSACAFTTAPTTRGGARSSYPSCDAWNKEVIADVKRQKPDIFINALYKMRARATGSEGTAGARTSMVEGVRDAVSQVADTGAKVIMLNSTPMLDSSAPACVAAHPTALTSCTTPRARALDAEQTWDTASAKRVLSGAKGSILVDLDDYVCPASQCVPVIGDVLVYRDRHHITVQYMKTLAPMLESRLAAVTRG